MTNAIQDAIEKAKANAGTVAGAAPGTAVAPAQSGGAVGPARKLSMEDMQGNMSVNKWIKVKEFGLLIGDSSDLKKTIRVHFDATEGVGFMPKLSLKYGNPAIYKNTYDGVSVVGGGRWADAISEAHRVDPKAQPYRSVDLPFKVFEAIKDDKGQELAAVGQVIGHSTSTTNWRNFETFWRDVQKRGLEGKLLEVELGFQPMSNKNGNKWGILTLTTVGEVQPAAE